MDARGWNERYSKSGFEWGADPNRFLVREIDGLKPGRALDLGAGEGRNAIWLAERGWNVTAVDFSDVAIDKARRWAAEREVDVEWVVDDLLRYQPPVGHFDLVIIFYIHLSPLEWRDLLRKAEDALAPGGTLLIVGHDRTNLRDGVGGPQDPELLLDASEVVSLLREVEIERAERVTRPVEGADREAIDALIRSRISSRPGYDPA